MPLTKFAPAPGLIKDDTPLASEGGWIDADKIRFVNGLPEVIGGWQAASHDTFAGIARGKHCWADLTGQRYLAWGTAANLYVMVGSTIRDITPPGLPPGAVDGSGPVGGYGSGAYSSGGYGLSDSGEGLPRVWFLDNWGETLLALPRGGALYQWQPALEYPELIQDTSFIFGWSAGAGWSLSSGLALASAGTASDLSTPVPVKPGYVYRVELRVTPSAGSLVIRSNAGDLGDASEPISITGDYSRVFRAPAGMTTLVLHKDLSFAGSADLISVTLESLAYSVDEAPPFSQAMFIDPHQIVVLLGTAIFGGIYDPLAVRWCDRQNLTLWTPDVNNLAGDDILSAGSRLISGLATRQQNLIWSDSALYTMQYTGNPAVPFLFDRAGTGCGLIGPLACTEHNGIVFWVGTTNFFSYTGATPVPIPSRIERDVFNHIATNQEEKTVCGILPGRSEFWTLYADSRDGVECSRYATFRTDEQHWTAGTLARSSWVTPGLFEHPILFGTDGVVYEHEVGATANGGVIEFRLDSAYSDLGDGDVLMMLRRIEGDFRDLVGFVDFTVYSRNWSNSNETAYGPFRHMVDTKKLDMRVTARQIRIRLSATASPLYFRLGALRLDILPSGAKR